MELRFVLKIIGKDSKKIVIRQYLKDQYRRNFFPTYTHYK